MKRFLGFLEQIRRSPKKIPSFLLNIIKNDARSSTGQNLRNMMLLFDKNSIDDIKEKDILEFVYAPVENNDEWKIQMIRELIHVRNTGLEIENVSNDEVELMIEYLCTS